MTLPKDYAWLAKEPGPKMLVEALALYGTREKAGAADNPIILEWAKECGIAGYSHDSIAWCGLAMAVAAKRAGWDFKPNGNALWALNWARWGDPVKRPMLGDILTFKRPGGGHVALYVGEDATAFHCLGGNQGDAVSIVRIVRSRLYAARRAQWKISEPENVRVVSLSASGAALSKNEA